MILNIYWPVRSNKQDYCNGVENKRSTLTIAKTRTFMWFDNPLNSCTMAYDLSMYHFWKVTIFFLLSQLLEVKKLLTSTSIIIN